MPKAKKACTCCRRIFVLTRNPKQQYCSRAECQRARKNQWRRDARHNDADYRSNQQLSNQRWQAKHPDYWKQYRASHQPYVVQNREKQRLRAKNATKQRQSPVTDLAKSDVLCAKNPFHSGHYWLVPVLADHLAKSDALRVKIDLISAGFNSV